MPDAPAPPRTAATRYAPPDRHAGHPTSDDPPRATARPRSGLVWRIFFAAAAAVCLILLTVLGTVSLFARRSTDAALDRALADARRRVVAILDQRTSALTSGAAVFARNPDVRSLLLDGRRSPGDVLDRAQEAADQLGATWVQLTDGDGVRLAKSDEPTAPAASLDQTALVGGALAGRPTTGAGVAGDTAVFEGVAIPVTMDTAGTRVVGVLVAARVLDSAAVREIREETQSDALLYFLDARRRPRVVASSLDGAARHALVGEVGRRLAHGGVGCPLSVHLGGTSFVGDETPLRSADGTIVGGVLTLRSRDRELAPFVALQRWIALAGLGGLLLAFGVAYGVARQITGPIRALRDAARRAAAGDFSSTGVHVASAGEVGELADAVQSVLDQVQERHELAALLDRARATPAAGAAPRPPVETLPIGTRLAGRYAIEGVLGVGGNGVVYRARDLELGETVAVKTLRPEALAGGPEALERLKDEIRLARRITHAGVVRLHDMGVDDGTYFITMEHVAGLPLAEILRRVGRLAAPQVVAVGKQLCGALSAAHARGVIHRDVKPQNIVVQPDGALKVLDFGVARLSERTSGLTVAGLVIGTPAYMAPEQLLDEPVDARADVYAAGVVLYEAATGRMPHEAPTPAALIARVLTDAPTPPATLDVSIPRALSDAIMRALARERGDRLASAAALHELLSRAARDIAGQG